MSMLTLAAPEIESPLYALAALLGTIGLTWAILGVEGGHRWVVVMLLGIGIAAFAWRFTLPVVDSLQSVMSSSLEWRKVFGLLLSVWFVLGPLVVGVFQIFRLVRDTAGSPNKSLERTRGS
jgi:hypothetical protein